MFETWGRVLYARRRLTLGLTLIVVAIAAVWGTGVFGKLSSGDNFTPPASQSQREASQASQVFGRDDADVVVLYRSATMSVADPGYRQAVTAALSGLPRADVARVTTYWSSGSPSLVSTDRHATYAVLQLTGADDAARHKTYDAIKTELTPASLAASGVTATVGGNVPMEVAINSEVTADIAKAEGFSMPVLLILLMVIFGSLAAAALPVAIGGVAILGSFAVLRLLTMTTTVSIYSVNITTILGLGLGIDYGLFMVTRFREELHRQPTVERAVARTVATAGRTVAVSGVTVAVALTSLMLFPEDFLRSMGYGGVATVAVDMLAALTVLPALLAVLGYRVNALRIRRSVQTGAGQGRDQRGLVPAGAQRHAQARRLRHGDRDRAAGPRRAVPAHLLGRHGRQDAARRLDGQAGVADPGPRFPRQLDGPDRGARHAAAHLGGRDSARRLPAPHRGHPRRHPGSGHRGGGRYGPGRYRLRPAHRVVGGQAASSPRYGTPRRRPGRRCSSAGPRPGSWTNWPAWARRCRGWPCWSACQRSCCYSSRSARWCCR